MAKIIRYLFYILLFTLYIYSVKFTFFPLTGKMVMAILGMAVWVIDFLKGKLYISKYDVGIFIAGLFLLFWGLFVVLLNSTNQLIYVDYFISLASAFFASYFLYKFTKRDIKTLNSLLKVIVLTVFAESLITVGLRFLPGFQDVIFALQEFQTRDVSDQSLLNINRFVGIGEAVYFGVLPSCALGLVSLISLIVYETQNGRKLFYWLVFVVITVVSFVVARYSVAISVLCMAWYVYILLKKGEISKILSVILFSLIGVFSLFFILKQILPDGVFAWAFEMLDGGQSDTLDTLKDWYLNTSFNVFTFIVGDGIYVNQDGSYYGGVDMGLYRQIFYSGIIGLLLLYNLHRNILKSTCFYLTSNQMRNISLLLIFSFIIIMLKGDKSIYDLCMIYYVYARFSKFDINKFHATPN